MIKRFLIGFDGSALSREAFAYSSMLAKKLDAEIVAIHVIEPATIPSLGGNPAVLIDPMMPPVMLSESSEVLIKEERTKAEHLLEELDDMCDEMEIAYSQKILMGTLIDVLLAEAVPGDVIALGLKGRFRHTGVGSSTRALIARSPCPFLVVSGQLKPVNRIFTPYDGTVASTRAVVFARDLAKNLGWPLTVLAMPRGELTLDEALDWATLLADDAQVIASNPEQGTEAEIIEKTVEHDPYALLVMGAYADSWIKDLFAGSVTGHVLSHLQAPMILVPKKATEEE